MCITKLDVLDGLETVKICVAYRMDGRELETPPVEAEELERCEPVLVELPGWQESTVGARSMDALPDNARRYLRKVEDLCGTPIDIVSTGPDRDETLVLRHPFE
jgi:adenylosuccinate synthase